MGMILLRTKPYDCMLLRSLLSSGLCLLQTDWQLTFLFGEGINKNVQKLF